MCKKKNLLNYYYYEVEVIEKYVVSLTVKEHFYRIYELKFV